VLFIEKIIRCQYREYITDSIVKYCAWNLAKVPKNLATLTEKIILLDHQNNYTEHLSIDD